MSETSHVMWHRSSWCGSSDCVEVAVAGHTDMGDEEDGSAVFLVRDSMIPDGQFLRIGPDAWAALAAHIKEEVNL